MTPSLPARMLLDLYLRPNKYRGRREFAVRPRWQAAEREMVAVDIRSRQGLFHSTLHLRAGSTDIQTFEQIFLYAHYQMEDLARRDAIVAYYESCANPLILDLGANVGLSALYFAKNWPRATIIGLEPDAGNHALFCRNTADQPNIIALRAAAASVRGHARIVNPDDAAWGFRTALVDGADGDVQALPVSDLLDRHGGCEPFICKIDIEGAERELFSGNIDWVARFPVLIIELHDWLYPCSDSSAGFLRAIATQHRDFIIRGENIFSISHDMPCRRQHPPQ